MLEGQDGSDVGAGVPLDNHSLLLSLAGLIDDELLGWGRELAAVGEFDHALELITATVAAEDVRLPEPVHTALLGAQRGRPGVELPGPEKGPVQPHRFLADPASAGYPAAVSDSSPVEALRGMPGRLLRGCQLWLSWRLTPAGAAPTPVPHPVLLIETADGAGADLLAYQVADLLGRSGAFVSVEVFGPDCVVGDYHRAALDASVALDDLEFTGSSVQLDTASDTAPPPAGPPPAGPSPLDAPLPKRESGGRPPLQPVERVIAARASAPRNPIDNVMPFERGPHERPLADRPPADRPFPDRPLFDRGGPGQPDRPLIDRPGYPSFDGPEDRAGRGPLREPRQAPPRDQRGRPRDEAPLLGPSRPPNTGPGDRQGLGQGPSGPPPKQGPMTGAYPAQGPSGTQGLPAGPQGHAGPQGLATGPQGPATGPQGPATGPQGPAGPPGLAGGPGLSGPPPGSMSGAFPAHPTGRTSPNPAQPIGMTGPTQAQPGPMTDRRPMDRRPPERNAMNPRNGGGPDRNGAERTAMMPERGPGPDRNGPDRNGMGRNGAPGSGAATRAVPPVQPPPVSQPTARQQPVQQPPPPQGPPPAGQPPRPPLRPVDLPELPDGLSDVEQKLLRQLHEELAAREDDGQPAAGQAPQRAYRNGSNGASRPPQKPMGPPQDK